MDPLGADGRSGGGGEGVLGPVKKKFSVLERGGDVRLSDLDLVRFADLSESWLSREALGERVALRRGGVGSL